MTVQELVELLRSFDPEADVVTVQNCMMSSMTSVELVYDIDYGEVVVIE